jgi:hypothetical protein
MSGNIFGCDKSGEGARDRSMRQRHHSGEPLVWAQGIGEPVRSAGSLILGDAGIRPSSWWLRTCSQPVVQSSSLPGRPKLWVTVCFGRDCVLASGRLSCCLSAWVWQKQAGLGLCPVETRWQLAGRDSQRSGCWPVPL